MRVVIQRVSEASVKIDGAIKGAIEQGLVVLLGIHANDDAEDMEWLLKKISGLRVFSDDEGKMNHSIKDVNGALLLISQFTLYASTKKGNRPSYIHAAPPAVAIPLYEQFIAKAEAIFPNKIQTGIFGADMKVSLVNDGPVTIIIDSKNRE